MAAAARAPAPSLAQLQEPGPDRREPRQPGRAVQKAIQATADDGSGVDTLPELQALVDGRPRIDGACSITATGLAAITAAEQTNNATEGTTQRSRLQVSSGVTGVDAATWRPSTAPSTPRPSPARKPTRPPRCKPWSTPTTMLAAADASRRQRRSKPTARQTTTCWASPVWTARPSSTCWRRDWTPRPALMWTAPAELQTLADAVAAVIAGAAPTGSAPSLAQLQDLGVTGVNPANLAAVQAAIRATADDGAGVDTLPELQAPGGTQATACPQFPAQAWPPSRLRLKATTPPKPNPA
jgi:hypothetical protein